MSLAVCPGSYDPITVGHVDVIRRARDMFDRVVVVIANNPGKKYLLNPEQRADLARASLAHLEAVQVEVVPGLLATYCGEIGANAIVKGVRGPADFDGEQAMALMNRHLSGIDTIFIMGDPTLGHVASSLVKDIAGHGGRIDDLVPAPVVPVLRAALTAPDTTPPHQGAH